MFLQVLHVSAVEGSRLPLPLTACVGTTGRDTGSLCSVTVHDHNGASPGDTEWKLSFKIAMHASCTLERISMGQCTACSVSVADAGRCPAGTHTAITDVIAPGGLVPETSLAISLHVGASLFSADVMVQFAVVSDSTHLNEPEEGNVWLQAMLLQSQVLQASRHITAVYGSA
jgi:hypothetical protein